MNFKSFTINKTLSFILQNYTKLYTLYHHITNDENVPRSEMEMANQYARLLFTKKALTQTTENLFIACLAFLQVIFSIKRHYRTTHDKIPKS